jgi:hypothetical protein
VVYLALSLPARASAPEATPARTPVRG